MRLAASAASPGEGTMRNAGALSRCAEPACAPHESPPDSKGVMKAEPLALPFSEVLMKLSP